MCVCVGGVGLGRVCDEQNEADGAEKRGPAIRADSDQDGDNDDGDGDDCVGDQPA